jgi:hypothetical protein
MVDGMVGVPLSKDKGEKMQRQRQKQEQAKANYRDSGASLQNDG